MKIIDKLEEIFSVSPGERVSYNGYTIQVTYYEVDGEIVADLPGGWKVWEDGELILATEDYNDLKLFFNDETNN